MGGRGSSAARRGGAGGGAAFTVTPSAGGGVTITPNAQQGQNIAAQAGGGVSDTNTHTTYFTPGDWAIVNGDPTNGYRRSPRSGTMQAIGYFNTGDYANINGELRDLANGNRRKLTAETQRVVDAMDRNMRKLNNPIDTTRWTDMKAIRDNLGLPPGTTKQQIVAALTGRDITRIKTDYTSSTWKKDTSSVAGKAGREVKLNLHYAKGAEAAFSPTGKEHEMVGARNKPQRYSNASIQRTRVDDPRGSYMADVLVIDCYIDS